MLSTDEQGLSLDRIPPSLKIDIDNIQCSICYDVLWKPIACQSCETPFCSRCIAEWLQKPTDQCPMRCGKYVQRRCPRFFVKSLAKMQVFCIYEPSGCNSILPYEALYKHERQCGYRTKECPGCHTKFLKKDLDEHETNCPFVELTCEQCKLVCKRIDVSVVHTKIHCLRGQLRHAEDKNEQLNEQLKQQSAEHKRELHRIRQECEEHIQQATGIRTRWPRFLPNIPSHARWTQNGLTVAGGQDEGDSLNQLSGPFAICVDDDQTLYVADGGNHRIMAWKPGKTSGQVVAGGNGRGNRTDQLNRPMGVMIDKDTDSLIISDVGNRRIVRWSRRTANYEETILDDIDCALMIMDDQRFLYVSDIGKYEVKRYRMGEIDGTVVAGGHGSGSHLNQLKFPTYLFLDREESIFVSDTAGHRVMKWPKGATEGIVVAGDRGEGDDWTQLSNPDGVMVDQLGAVYVADLDNHRVVRWYNGVTQVVGGNGAGSQANQLNEPSGLSFDRLGNLYVVDHCNHRVQRFDIQI